MREVDFAPDLVFVSLFAVFFDASLFSECFARFRGGCLSSGDSFVRFNPSVNFVSKV